MSAEDRPCDACNALPGELCAWDCIGLASHLDEIESSLTADHVSPGAASAADHHCLVCQAATPAHGSALIARALTVEASKLYAVLHYRAELDSTR